jgi:hypothetical protein
MHTHRILAKPVDIPELTGKGIALQIEEWQ